MDKTFLLICLLSSLAFGTIQEDQTEQRPKSTVESLISIKGPSELVVSTFILGAEYYGYVDKKEKRFKALNAIYESIQNSIERPRLQAAMNEFLQTKKNLNRFREAMVDSKSFEDLKTFDQLKVSHLKATKAYSKLLDKNKKALLGHIGKNHLLSSYTDKLHAKTSLKRKLARLGGIVLIADTVDTTIIAPHMDLSEENVFFPATKEALSRVDHIFENANDFSGCVSSYQTKLAIEQEISKLGLDNMDLDCSNIDFEVKFNAQNEIESATLLVNYINDLGEEVTIQSNN